MNSEREIIGRLREARILDDKDDDDTIIRAVHHDISTADTPNISESKDPDAMYQDYLTRHVEGVKRVFNEIMKPVLESEGYNEEELAEIEDLILTHDASKRTDEEWSAYRNYFYDPENHPRSGSEEFDIAWNHHQKTNPHHWNYWVLINDVDEPQVHALDMPFKYIIEMLCDWQSAGQHYGNTAYDWYEKQNGRMILSPKTRDTVEKYIVHLK